MSADELNQLAELVAARLSRAVEPMWLDPVQAAVYSGLSVKYLEQMRRDGGGPSYSRVGRLVRYNRTDLDRFMRGESHA